jgi:superfamily II DNA helicase RecQ
MSDQVTSFVARGIPSVYVSDKQTLDEIVKEGIQRGEYRIVLTSPEALFARKFSTWKKMLSIEVLLWDLL